MAQKKLAEELLLPLWMRPSPLLPGEQLGQGSSQHKASGLFALLFPKCLPCTAPALGRVLEAEEQKRAGQSFSPLRRRNRKENPAASQSCVGCPKLAG